jgi:hypothetical protein
LKHLPVLQPAFDERWGAFLQVLAAGLGLGAEDHDVNEAGVLAPLAILAFDAGVDRQPQGGDRGAGGAVAHLGVAGQMADEQNHVDSGHDRPPLGGGERGRVIDGPAHAGTDRPRPLANGLQVGMRRVPWGARARVLQLPSVGETEIPRTAVRHKHMIDTSQPDGLGR